MAPKKKDTETRGLVLLTEEETASEVRTFELSGMDWWDLLHVVRHAVELGGSVGLYTSRDGNVFCVSIKSGNQGKQYWCGPDDEFGNKLAQIERDWGLKPNHKALNEWLTDVLKQHGAVVTPKKE